MGSPPLLSGWHGSCIRGLARSITPGSSILVHLPTFSHAPHGGGFGFSLPSTGPGSEPGSTGPARHRETGSTGQGRTGLYYADCGVYPIPSNPTPLIPPTTSTNPTNLQTPPKTAHPDTTGRPLIFPIIGHSSEYEGSLPPKTGPAGEGTKSSPKPHLISLSARLGFTGWQPCG